MVCAIGNWRLLAVALVQLFSLLVFGARFEPIFRDRMARNGIVANDDGWQT
jgi:hypothetical protein